MDEVQRINPQALMSSLGPSPRESIALTLAKSGSEEVSVLAGPPASAAHIATVVHKLSVCFPDMSSEFFSILAERIEKAGMSGKRLEYALNRVLDAFTYKRLTIADILGIDVKCRILTYSARCNEVARNGGSTDDYAPIRISGAEKPGWVLKGDKARYNIPDEL